MNILMPNINPVPAPQKIALVGCKGRMGSLLSACWTALGHQIAGVDAPLTDSALAASVADAVAVFLCVPAGVMTEVLTLLVPHLNGTQILADITSVKIRPMEQMQAAYDGPVVGTHPLFGPIPPKEDLRVCITPGTLAQEHHIRLVEQFFTHLNCTTFRATPKEHDEATAAIQGLNFISNLAYFATLAHHEELLPYVTPSFQKRMAASRKMLTEDAPLFEWLFEANPMSQQAVRQYRSFLNVAAGGDISLLVQRAHWWWKPTPTPQLHTENTNSTPQGLPFPKR